MAIRLNLPPHGKRLIFDLSQYGLPEIPYLAAQNLPFTTTGLPSHSHKERMEINHILKGERVYAVGGKDYHLRGNDIFCTWPGEMHGSGSYLHGRGVHMWMQVAMPEPGNPFLGFESDRVASLLEALHSLPKRHFKAEPGMKELFSRVLSICGDEPSEFGCIEISALLLQWFLLLARASTEKHEEAVTPDIARVLELMSGDRLATLSIRDLAEAACLSESRFKGKFREQLGVPPGEYMLRRRTEMAADMLARGVMSMTEIALELGFSSMQHFSATFKIFFGQSPASWLKRQSRMFSDMSADASGSEDLLPWIDEGGLVHGYVHRTYNGGKHPEC